MFICPELKYVRWDLVLRTVLSVLLIRSYKILKTTSSYKWIFLFWNDRVARMHDLSDVPTFHIVWSPNKLASSKNIDLVILFKPTNRRLHIHIELLHLSSTAALSNIKQIGNRSIISHFKIALNIPFKWILTNNFFKLKVT